MRRGDDLRDVLGGYAQVDSAFSVMEFNIHELNITGGVGRVN